MDKITCFKAYDVRGRIPDQLNEDIAYRIGRAYADVIKPKKVVVGHDIRLTSEAIKAAVNARRQDSAAVAIDSNASMVRCSPSIRRRITCQFTMPEWWVIPV